MHSFSSSFGPPSSSPSRLPTRQRVGLPLKIFRVNSLLLLLLPLPRAFPRTPPHTLNPFLIVGGHPTACASPCRRSQPPRMRPPTVVKYSLLICQIFLTCMSNIPYLYVNHSLLICQIPFASMQARVPETQEALRKQSAARDAALSERADEVSRSRARALSALSFPLFLADEVSRSRARAGARSLSRSLLRGRKRSLARVLLALDRARGPCLGPARARALCSSSCSPRLSLCPVAPPFIS